MLKIASNKILKSSIVFSLISFCFSAVFAAEIKTDSKISAVTVYPGSAKITRTSSVSLKPGANEIIINNLPINLNESSLRVSGEGDAGVSLGSVQLIREIKQDVVQQQERDLLQKIEEIKEGKKEIEDVIERNNSQLDYIRKIVFGNQPIGKRKDDIQNNSYSNLPLEQWEQAWKTLDEATERVQIKIRNANRTLKEKDKQLAKLKKELQQIATNQKEVRAAKLNILADISSELDLKISYQINGARWEPVYDMDLNTQTGEIQMKTLAQISQRTGENWQGVDVTLSTLRPTSGTQLPNLNPWVLDFLPEGPEISARSFNSGMTMDSVQMETMAAPVVKSMAPKVAKRRAPMKQQQSRLISADFSAEYKVPGVISLDSGSDKRRFALNSNKLSSDIKLASSPRYDSRAMILATTKYEEETPLLAGSMSLYRNGNYVGNTFIQQKQSGEELKLSFGEDDKIKIKFMPDPDKKRKDGLLFGKKKVVERHYQVSISSNHSKPFPISISDVIPVGSDENIKVKRLGEAPTVIDLEDKKGVLSWDKVIAPNQNLKIKYGYSVSYPEDKVIPGL